ncbi:MAG: hypothetical protein AB1847_05560 [bacterium]
MALPKDWTYQGQATFISSLWAFSRPILPILLGLGVCLLASLPILLKPALAQGPASVIRIDSIKPPKMTGSGSQLVTARGDNLDQISRVILTQSFPYIKGTISTQGIITALDYKSPYVYAISDYSRILIIDVSDPNHLEARQYQDQEFSNSLQGITISDNYLLVTDLYKGLWIIDISNPARPRRTGRLPDSLTYGVLVGKRENGTGGAFRKVYLTNWKSGLKIYDWYGGASFTLKKTSPALVSPFNLDVQDLTHERYIYIASNNTVEIVQESSGKVVRTLDEYFLTDPGLPSYSPNIIDVKVKDNCIYLVDNRYGLYVVDVQVPEYPFVLYRLPLPDGRKSITIRGNLAIVAAGSSGLDMVDISLPSNPVLRYHIPTQGNAVCTAFENTGAHYAFIANSGAGFALLDLGSLAVPSSIGHLPMGGDIWDLTVAEKRAYISMGRQGLKVVDVKNPWNPRLVYTIEKEDIGSDTVLISDCCPYRNGFYLVNGSSLCTFKSSDGLGKPSLMKPAISWNDPIQSLSIEDNYLYQVSLIHGLRVFQINSAMNLTPLGSVPLGSMPQDIAMKDRVAYIASGEEGLWIMNVENPAKPYKVSQKPVPFSLVLDVSVKDGYAYLADGSGGLAIVNVDSAHRANPVISRIMEFENEYLEGCFVQGDFLYAAGNSSGLWIMDLSTPSSPAVLDNMLTSGGANIVFADQDYIYAANRFGMLDIYLAPKSLPIEGAEPTGSGLARDPNSIQFLIPSGLPHGFYDFLFLNAQGEKIRWYQALQVEDPIPLPFKAGLNFFGYPGEVPAEYSTSYNLLNALKGSAYSLYRNDPREVCYWKSQTPGGDIFPMEDGRGYLLYVSKDSLLTNLCADYFYPMDALLPQTGSELQEGTTWISFPTNDTGFFSSTVFEKLKESSPDNGNSLAGVQRLNAFAGKWETTYGFFNQRCGRNFPIRRGEGYMIFKRQ